MKTCRLLAAFLCLGAAALLAGCGGSSGTGGGGNGGGGSNNPVPAISNVNPTVVITGAGATTVTVTGTNFISSSTVLLSGTSWPTSYVSPTELTFTIPTQSAAQIDAVSVTNPAPGGGTASGGNIEVLSHTTAPTIDLLDPAQFNTGSESTPMIVYGSNLVQQIGTTAVAVGTVMWNGSPLSTAVYTGATPALVAQVPASMLLTAGAVNVTVTSPAATPSTSTPAIAYVGNTPAPTLSYVSPAGGPINTSTPIQIVGTGFISSTTVALDGVNVPSTFKSGAEIDSAIPASAIATPGNINFTMTTPGPGGGTSAPFTFTAFVPFASNDMVYNPANGLLYLSVPSSTVGLGNSVIGLDPATGNLIRQVWVGSNPNKLALSTDGTQLFVGLDGAGAVAQVNLLSGKVVNQFSVGTGEGITGVQYTAFYMAAVPGQPNSVVVVIGAPGSLGGTGTGLAIFDSGVPRSAPWNAYPYGAGPICFGANSSTIYMSNGTSIYQLTVGATGVSAPSTLATVPSALGNSIQFDNGRIYLANGAVVDATSGSLLGAFNVPIVDTSTGPIVSDSSLGLAFYGSPGSSNAGVSSFPVLVYNENTFSQTGSIPIYDVQSNTVSVFEKIVRWGQDGVALNTGTQIFTFRSPVVKDLSSSPADLSVSLNAPQSAANGTAFSYVATVENLGPNAAQNATLDLTLDSSLIVNSVTPSQGSCGTGSAFTCDLGGIASGATASVTVSVTPTTAQSVAATALVSSVSYDPAAANNQATTNTTVTGSSYAMAPSVTSISPLSVQAGSGAFTLTVNGSGFNQSLSTVNVGGMAMPSTYVSATQLTAQVSANAVASYGWAPVTVTNPPPGGGTSTVVPLTIYAAVNLPANSILFDPFSQNLYATVPGSATNIAGNSIVAINPYTATVGTPIPIGSGPDPMAETSDGNYLFVGLDGSDSLVQFDLLHQTVSATVPISASQGGSPTPAAAASLAALPGSDSTLAIGLSGYGGLGIFDISGSAGGFRQNLANFNSGEFMAFGDAENLYAVYNGLARYTVDSEGLTPIDDTSFADLGGIPGADAYEGGLLFGGNGAIINPATTPPSLISTLPLFNFGQYPADGYSVIASPYTQKEFILQLEVANTADAGLIRYDLIRDIPEAYVALPVSNEIALDQSWSTLHFGQDGIAALATITSEVGQPPSTVLFLLRGPFVTPQELATNSAATLTSSSAPTLAHGSGNSVLTLTGTNLLPGVAVTWNGLYRSTTWISSTEAIVDIPASDLTNPGSGSLVATNPGAPASNALTIAIN